MRRPIVAGNWKMHGTRADNARLIEELLGGHPDRAAAECLVFPPFVYLQEVGRLVRDTPIGLGAQSVCAEAQGAFTGEVSAGMLKDVGCSHVLVGHSERRWIYHEDDQLVARKFAAAQAKSLVPILCVGEHLWDRENGRTEEMVSRQLDAVIDLCGVAALQAGIIAYEPMWAIGTGRTATPEQAQAVHAFIRERIGERDAKIANATRVLYGGSVKGSNAAELFAQPDVDGGLIGGASLNAEEFLAILAACGSR
ncbi:MAG: triose-phosphate isomerase [Steroidobacteraceae bacterium]